VRSEDGDHASPSRWTSSTAATATPERTKANGKAKPGQVNDEPPY
jgi:hypothetical protein